MEGWGTISDPLAAGGVLHYRLTVGAEDLRQLYQTPLQERATRAELMVGDRRVGPVELRLAGSTAERRACFRGGKRLCAKVSFRLDLDADASATGGFSGLDRIELHAPGSDASLLRERLAGELFARMDVPTPRASHAFVSLNDEREGLYTVVEAVGPAFARARWGEEGDGNIYRDVWPTSSEPAVYAGQLANDADEAGTRDNQVMARFAAALRTSPPGELGQVVERFLDVEEVQRYLAVDRAINNAGGVTTLHCKTIGEPCASANVFWYQHPYHGRFVWVPTALGATLLLRTAMDTMPEWPQKPVSCAPRLLSEAMGLVLPPGCDPLFQGLAADVVARDRVFDELLAVWSVPSLHALIDRWAADIAVAVANDPTGPTELAWRAGVARLKSEVAILRERLAALRDGREVPPYAIAIPGPTHFEDASGLAFSRGASVVASAGTAAAVALGEAGAIEGGKDVRFEFEFGNGKSGDADADAPFAELRLPFAGTSSPASPAVLGGLQRLRIELAADHVRNLRVEIDSPAYGHDGIVDHYGWDLVVGQSARVFELDVAKLALPLDAPAASVSRSKVLGAATGLVLRPQPRRLDEEGFLPAGTTDPGFVRVDGIGLALVPPRPPGPGRQSVPLYDEAALLDFALGFPPGEWEKLLTMSGPADRRWVRCTFAALGDKPVQAACRRKGDPEDWEIEKRPQLLVRFNVANKSARYRGLRRINLEALASTGAPIRDRLAMWLMRQAGVDAPRVNHVRVWKDGVLLGLYQNIEEVDREFLQDHFRYEAGGNLWEGGTELKTNEAVRDATRLRALEALVAAEPLRGDHAAFFLELPNHVDISQLLREMAAEAALLSIDNFGNGGPNFMYYEHPRRGLMVLPWDLDRVLTTAPADANPYDYRGAASGPNKLRLLMNANPDWRAEFEANLVEIRDTVLVRMPAKVDQICDQIRSLGAVDDECEALKYKIRQRLQALRTALPGGGP